jgi:NitT/TauT family transport system substrate-binding protein
MAQVLRIEVPFHLPFYAPVWVAQRLGTFRDEGLDVQVHTGVDVQAHVGHPVFAYAGIMRSLVLADQASPVRLVAIAEVNSRDGFFILSRQPTSNFHWSDLVGKELATFSLAPTPWMCLQGVLRRHGVDPGQTRLRTGLRVAEGIAALLSGEVDFLQTSQPMAEELIEQGKAYLAVAQAPDVGHVPYSSFIVTSELRDRDPDLCARAVIGLTRALAWMATENGAAIADLIQSEFPDIRPDVLRRVVAGYQAAGTWSDGPHQQREPFERLAGYLVSGGLIHTAARYEDLVDNRFAAAATSAS